MQRADRLDLEAGRLLQNCLYLCTVFSDDTDIVAAGFTCPVFFDIESSELTESVRTEKHFIESIVCHDNFRPVHHRCPDKLQDMLAERKLVALTDDDAAVFEFRSEEILHHGEGFLGRYDLGIRIVLHEVHDIGGVVRLHVLDHEVIRSLAFKCFFQIIEPLMREILIDRIHDRDLIIRDHIGVIRHTVRHHILALKKVDIVVIYANILDIVTDKHSASLS